MPSVLGADTTTTPLRGVVTVNRALVAGRHMRVSAANGNRAMTLPPGLPGTTVSVAKHEGSANRVDVTGPIAGASNGVYALSFQDEWVKLRFGPDGFWWAIEASPARTRVVPVTGNYTLQAPDARNTRVEITSTVANTLIVPAGLIPNEWTEILILGTGVTTIAGGTGMTPRSRGNALKSAGQGAIISVLTRTSGEFLVAGDVAA